MIGARELVTQEYKRYSTLLFALMIHVLITMVLCFWVLAGNNIPQNLMAWKIFHIIAAPLALHLWYSSNFPLHHMMMVYYLNVSTETPSSPPPLNTNYNYRNNTDPHSNNTHYTQGGVQLDNIHTFIINDEDEKTENTTTTTTTTTNTAQNTRITHRTINPQFTQIIHHPAELEPSNLYRTGKDRVLRGVVYIIVLYTVLLVLDCIYLGVILIPTMLECVNTSNVAIPYECTGWTSENNGRVLFGFTMFFSILHILSNMGIVIITYLNRSCSYEVFRNHQHPD